MSTLKKYIVPVLAVVAVVLGLWNIVPHHSSVAGSLNSQYVEQYSPEIRYNGGYNSQLPIQTSSTITSTGGFTSSAATTLSGATSVTGGLTVGSTGSSISQENFGTCILYQYVNTIAATSSVTTDCVNTSSAGFGTGGGLVVLPGVQKGDKVFVTLSTTTAGIVATSGGLDLQGASASSTNGYITITLTNMTGTTYTFPSGASSTVSYYTMR